MARARAGIATSPATATPICVRARTATGRRSLQRGRSRSGSSTPSTRRGSRARTTAATRAQRQARTARRRARGMAPDGAEALVVGILRTTGCSPGSGPGATLGPSHVAIASRLPGTRSLPAPGAAAGACLRVLRKRSGAGGGRPRRWSTPARRRLCCPVHGMGVEPVPALDTDLGICGRTGGARDAAAGGRSHRLRWPRPLPSSSCFT